MEGKMNRIENVSLQGLLCPIDNKPKRFETCLNCQHDVCDIPSLRARVSGVFPVIENEYHVTEAIGPPMIMKFRRENPYYVRPGSLIAMFIGTSVHEKIENENPSVIKHGYVSTHEFAGRWNLGDYDLVGTMDYVNFDRKLIQDYKCLGAWKTRQLLNNIKDDEYCHQLNVYRAAFYPEAEILRLHIFLKEFSMYAQKKYNLTDEEYRIDVPILDAEDELDMVWANIEESRKEEPRSCTPEETWGGIRCRKFCPNYNCMCYEGPEYNIGDVE